MNRMAALAGEVAALERAVAAFDTESAIALRRSRIAERDRLISALASANALVANAEQQYKLQLQLSDTAASLSLLVEHGELVGLHEGHCPLCDARRSSPEFQDGISKAKHRIEELVSGLPAARAALGAARDAARPFADALDLAEEAVVSDQKEEERHATVRQAISEYLSSFPPVVYKTSSELEEQVVIEREALIVLETALNVLGGSPTYSQLGTVQARVEQQRLESDQAFSRLSKTQTALERAKEFEKAVKRTSAEIADERLAQISPLLNELYSRLRPHSEWRSIEYSVRGDVRRFLSLRVGDGLNPQFVFSSGQRRAAGLAFLLSVHLSRSWTLWNTLMLDDPIQHIDDFRALHLVEVLSALRMADKQLVIAVEDADLSNLLCRRLAGDSSQTGRRYEIETGEDGSGLVAASDEIPPLPAKVLRREEAGSRIA